MKRIDKEPKKAKVKIENNKKLVKPKKKKVGEVEDVRELVHLLQVHQIELEHQNQELRIAHEELELSRYKYVNLFDFSPIPYFTLDINGVIKEVNISAGKMLGVDRNKLIDRRFISYIPQNEKDIYNSFISNVFSSSVKQSCELNVMSKDKRLFHVLLEGLEFIDNIETDKKCQIALIDMTEYKNIENSLKESTKELMELNNTKDKLFSIIAHDLRSPFQALLSSSELLDTEIEHLTRDDIAVFSRGLNYNLRNLYGLLDNLLQWSMLQRNILEYKPADFNLCELVTKVIGILNQSAAKKNLAIFNNVNSGSIVYADVDMIRTVMQNLIMNAIKFTPKEGRINITSFENGDFIEVSVQDTGVGIEPEKAAVLFSINAITTTNGTAGEKGTGLGLPLSKEFVLRNDGKIWVESILGKGSNFVFTLRKAIS